MPGVSQLNHSDKHICEHKEIRLVLTIAHGPQCSGEYPTTELEWLYSSHTQPCHNQDPYKLQEIVILSL